MAGPARLTGFALLRSDVLEVNFCARPSYMNWLVRVAHSIASLVAYEVC